LPPPCASLRIVNFTPVGAMALFSGAVLRDRRLAFFFPLLALFLGEHFHRLPQTHVRRLCQLPRQRCHRPLAPRSPHHRPQSLSPTLLGASVFHRHEISRCGQLGGFYPRTVAGPRNLFYVAGVPFFWNTLAGALSMSHCSFGGFPLAERFSPALQRSSQTRIILSEGKFSSNPPRVLLTVQRAIQRSSKRIDRRCRGEL